MQFKVAVILFPVTMVTIIPVSPFQQCQLHALLATFYNSSGCNRPADIISPFSPEVLVQDDALGHNITIGQIVGCTELIASGLTRQLTLEITETFLKMN